MKLLGLFAVFFIVAFSSIHADDNAIGDEVPVSAVLAAVESAVENGDKFVAVDDVVAAVHDSSDDLDENPFLRGIFRRCKSGECRKKCNAKGKNGACVLFKCVCWK